MKIKGKRVLKNGTIGAYVYNSKTKKWNWRFIGRQKGGVGTPRTSRTSGRRGRNTDEIEAEVALRVHNAGVNTQLKLNNVSRKLKHTRGTKFNMRKAYQKERDALLDYLDDKIRRTSRIRLKRRKKLQNIANYIRNSHEGEYITPHGDFVTKNLAKKTHNVEVLQKAYQDIGLILASGTKNDPQRFKNLTNQVVEHRQQRKINNRRTNQEAQVIVNGLMRNTNARPRS